MRGKSAVSQEGAFGRARHVDAGAKRPLHLHTPNTRFKASGTCIGAGEGPGKTAPSHLHTHNKRFEASGTGIRSGRRGGGTGTTTPSPPRAAASPGGCAGVLPVRMAAQDKVVTVMQIAPQRTASSEPGRCCSQLSCLVNLQEFMQAIEHEIRAGVAPRQPRASER